MLEHTYGHGNQGLKYHISDRKSNKIEKCKIRESFEHLISHIRLTLKLLL